MKGWPITVQLSLAVLSRSAVDRDRFGTAGSSFSRSGLHGRLAGAAFQRHAVWWRPDPSGAEARCETVGRSRGRTFPSELLRGDDVVAMPGLSGPLLGPWCGGVIVTYSSPGG